MNLGENEPVKMTMKTLWLIITGAFVVAAAGMRWELKLEAVQTASEAHTVKLKELAAVQAENHDTLNQMAYEQRAAAKLLNYIAGGRKGDPPPRLGTDEETVHAPGR